VLVQDSVHDEFVGKLKTFVEKIVSGDGFENGVNQGPLINKSQFEKVCKMVSDAKNAGAKCLVGGEPDPVGELFYKPTILTDVVENMELFEGEVFGPVVSVKKFATEQEALDIANNCRSGLAGYFYSNDIKQCWRVAKSLELGMVGINEGMISAPEAAFGGVKESGFGREGSSHGIDDYTNIKYLCFGNL